MPDPYLIGTDCIVTVNGLKQLAGGTLSHSYDGGDVAYATFDGDLIGLTNVSTTINIEVPQGKQAPIEAAIIVQRTTGVLTELTIVDKNTGEVATARGSMRKAGKSRAPKSAATRSYVFTVGGDELEV